ncbi:hypothetical protein [Candidatus Albibeggiatoa sp. nov. BB20]|uniref:hypothetical protein n=1 Tax=Candidatus Albibeggiatoa sp. nov. BB20 TaxID=3162723 RepID=UPI003365490D
MFILQPYSNDFIRILGNLIAPSIYTAVEVIETGNLLFFNMPHHIAYCGFVIIQEAIGHS